MQAMIIPGRQIQIGKAPVTKLCCQCRIAAKQRGRGKRMALCLKDVVVINRTKLADRAIDRAGKICFGYRPHADFERTGEEVVEAVIAGDVRISGLAHVDRIFANEPAYQPGR